jgi:YD repeat-containing protein
MYGSEDELIMATYNERDHLIKAFDALGNESQIVYNSDQFPAQVIDSENKTTFYEYDNEGRLIRSIDGVGNKIVRKYDETKGTFVRLIILI